MIALYQRSHLLSSSSLLHHSLSAQDRVSPCTDVGLELLSLGYPCRIYTCVSLCWSVPFLFLKRPASSTPPSFSVSPSPKSFMTLSTSSFLSLSPHFSFYHCLSIFVSLHLWCLSFSPSLPARVGPGGSGTAQPGRRCEQCGIQEAGRRHGNAPAPPSPRAGRACQEGAMVTSGACPPRAPPRPRTLLQDWARRGRPVVASAWSQEGLPSSKSFGPQCPRLSTYKVQVQSGGGEREVGEGRRVGEREGRREERL